MKSCAVLWRDLRRQSGELSSGIDKSRAYAHSVVDRISAVGGGNEHAVGDRAAPIAARLDPLQTQHRAHQATHIACVAIGVPSRRANNG